jgi:pimeloyl-ACP methyl ester carboxylesterase
MKQRAGIVGRKGAYRVLSQIREAHQTLKIHLIGHSFGGRLVTALADGPAGMKPIIPESMTLLQAAFSHNGFASKFDGSRDGFFRKVVTIKR